MKPLFVGQAPSRSAKVGCRALSGAVGARLVGLAGVAEGEFLRRVDTVNLLAAWPGRAGKGDLFPAAAARRGVMRLMRLGDFWARGRIILVGFGVARAFGIEDEAPCFWFRGWRPRQRVAIIPHPSGVNGWYNVAENEAMVRKFLSNMIGGNHG